MVQHRAWIVGRLQCLAEDHIVEGIRRIIFEVGVGVALDGRQAVAHAGVHAGLAQLDAAPVDLLGFPQMLQQRAIPAADIQHAAGGLHHVGDQL